LHFILRFHNRFLRFHNASVFSNYADNVVLGDRCILVHIVPPFARPIPSVCLSVRDKSRALLQRWETCLWLLLWGANRKSTPGYLLVDSSPTPTTTASPKLAAHNPQPSIGSVAGFP